MEGAECSLRLMKSLVFMKDHSDMWDEQKALLRLCLE